jgi:hypothetical protein
VARPVRQLLAGHPQGDVLRLHAALDRDELAALRASPQFGQLSPVRLQLLGGIGTGIDGQTEGDHLWGHYPNTTPLYSFLSERGLLDRLAWVKARK